MATTFAQRAGTMRTVARRSELGYRDHMITVALATCMIIGIFVDGWAHTNLDTSLETFFTPWHAIFYSGFAATAAWIGYQSLRFQAGNSRFDIKAIPFGYGLSVIGLIVFSVGGVGDMLWHTIFGIESGIDALFSPTHLLLFAGTSLILVGPLVAMWASDQPAAISLRRFLPVLGSMTMLAASTSFFFMDYSPVNDWAPVNEYRRWLMTLPVSDFDYGESSQLLSIAGVLIANAILITPLLFAMRRWRLPFGTATVMFAVVAALLSALTEFEIDEVILGWTIAGIAVDVLIRYLDPKPSRVWAFRAAGVGIPILLWTTHYLVITSFFGLGWVPELWTGAIVFAALTGLVLSVMLTPPGVSDAVWAREEGR
jgi:hypothetical protein